jgi:cyclophilin family peptidyl-prolyl cis-trans isomerase
MRAIATLARVGAAAVLAAGLTACGDDSDSASSAPATATGGLVGSAASVVPGCTTTPPDEVPPKKSYDAPPPMTISQTAVYTAVLDTSCGKITIRLDQKAAPKTVNNFVFLARERFYDGLTFHRTSPGFVIQGGDPSGDGSGGPGYEFEDELPDDGYPAGAVAMANAGPDTNGSQFFIVTGDASFLPNAYSKFGTVTKGLDAARRIESLAPPDAQPGDPMAETPRQPAFIHSVTITETG